MRLPQIIVGIDPGSTIGYAVLDFSGNIIEVGSEKNFPINELITRIISLGDPIIVGTDKKVVPYYVSQFSTKVGSKVIHPRKDLLVQEKRILIADFKKNNAHEMDALASARFALREISPMLERINKFAGIYDKHEIKDEITKMVFLDEISIKNAAEMIEAEKLADDTNNTDADTKPKIEKDKHEELRRKIRAYKNDIVQITSFNKRLLSRINDLEQKLESKSQSSQQKIDIKLKSATYLKEQKINTLMRMLDERNRIISFQKKSLDRMNLILSDIQNKVVIKKLPNLRYHTYETYNKMLGIKKGDILFVEQPNESNPDIVHKLKDIVEIIIYRTPPWESTRKLPFVFIDCTEFEFAETELFCAVSRESFDKVIRSRNFIENIVENYRKSRINAEEGRYT